jgi:hypothetical protein
MWEKSKQHSKLITQCTNSLGGIGPPLLPQFQTEPKIGPFVHENSGLNPALGV